MLSAIEKDVLRILAKHPEGMGLPWLDGRLTRNHDHSKIYELLNGGCAHLVELGLVYFVDTRLFLSEKAAEMVAEINNRVITDQDIIAFCTSRIGPVNDRTVFFDCGVDGMDAEQLMIDFSEVFGVAMDALLSITSHGSVTQEAMFMQHVSTMLRQHAFFV